MSLCIIFLMLKKITNRFAPMLAIAMVSSGLSAQDMSEFVHTKNARESNLIRKKISIF